MHGEQDTNVPVGESVRAHAALVAAGVPTELLLLPGEGHTIVGHDGPDLLDPIDRRVAHQVVALTGTDPVGREPRGTDPPVILDGYPAGPLDEAVNPDGLVREGYRDIIAALEITGIDKLRAAATELDRIRVTEGISFIADVDGELREQPFPLDPVPRVLSAEDWATISAGLRQRTRALNAFLADVYGEARIVREG